MTWLNKNSGVAQWLTVIVLIITVYFAWKIGDKQNNINESIRKIEDSVEVFAYTPSGFKPTSNGRCLLTLTNVGKVQLYITSYKIDATSTSVDNELLPAGQQQNTWYNIYLPTSTINQKKSITIKLGDSLQRHWESHIDSTYNGNGCETIIHKIIEIDN